MAKLSSLGTVLFLMYVMFCLLPSGKNVIFERLREVSAYRRLKNTNTTGGRVWQTRLLITECECVCANTNTIGGRV